MDTITRLLVTGDRNWTDGDVIYRALCALRPQLVVHGAARGADFLAGVAAARLGIRVEEHPALWQEEGRAAGPRRNLRMLATKPDAVVAFHHDLAASRGTRHMASIALAAKVPTYHAVLTDSGWVLRPLRELPT